MYRWADDVDPDLYSMLHAPVAWKVLHSPHVFPNILHNHISSRLESTEWAAGTHSSLRAPCSVVTADVLQRYSVRREREGFVLVLFVLLAH